MTATRALAFIGIGYAALILTSVITALLPSHVMVPEVTLVIVLYLGLDTRGHAPASSCALVALVLGYITDVLSAAPRGLHAASLPTVMLVVRAVASRLMVARVWQQVVVSFVVALAHGALVVALISPIYDGKATAALKLVPWNALATSLVVAPPLFKLLGALDRKLSPEPRGSLRMPGA
jgi:rod shape-determining protein MreD